MRNKFIVICVQISLLFYLGINAKTVLADEPFLGEVRWFAGNFAPRGWATCDGQILPISQNQSLFSLLGTTYGGDGRTTFALPDMRGRSMLNARQGPGLPNYRLGQRSGSENETVTSAQLAAHTHTLRADNSGGDSVLPDDRVISEVGRIELFDSSANEEMGASSIETVGGGQSHNNMQPYIAMTCIIALQGIFPSRN